MGPSSVLNFKKGVDRILPLKAVVFDFDGVWTDNSVFVSEKGEEWVSCSRSDSYGLRLLRQLGIELLILSTEANSVVSARGAKLRIPVLQGVENKLPALANWANARSLRLSEIAFVGNDINDLEVMKAVGLGVAVADAFPEVLRDAHLVLTRPGGRGAVRELCEGLYLIKKSLSLDSSPWDVYTSEVQRERTL